MSQAKVARNVIIFGDAGVGKSSIVNMVLGSEKTKTSGGASRCTFESSAFGVELDGNLYNLHDTAGLGDYASGSLDVAKAIGNLYTLLTKLSESGGIHLLIFVVKIGRLTEITQKNYELFYNGFCGARVPIVVVVTGCENVEPPMESWWTSNGGSFAKAGMQFRGHACICAYRGRKTRRGGYANEDLVEESKGLVDELIISHCESTGWKRDPKAWSKKIVGFVNPAWLPKWSQLYGAASKVDSEAVTRPPVLANGSEPLAPFSEFMTTYCQKMYESFHTPLTSTT